MLLNFIISLPPLEKMRYNQTMYNWSGTDPSKFPSQKKREIWELEQAINYGLNNTKLSAQKLSFYWDQLTIDEPKRKALQILLNHEAN